MEKSRALACFHDLLHKVGGVPEDKLRLYGLSSLRKFLPNVGRANKLDNAMSSPSAALRNGIFFLEKQGKSTGVRHAGFSGPTAGMCRPIVVWMHGR